MYDWPGNEEILVVAIRRSQPAKDIIKALNTKRASTANLLRNLGERNYTTETVKSWLPDLLDYGFIRYNKTLG